MTRKNHLKLKKINCKKTNKAWISRNSPNQVEKFAEVELFNAIFADLPSRGVRCTVILKAVKIMAKEKAKKKLLHTTLFDFATEELFYQLQLKRLKKNYTSKLKNTEFREN